LSQSLSKVTVTSYNVPALLLDDALLNVLLQKWNEIFRKWNKI